MRPVRDNAGPSRRHHRSLSGDAPEFIPGRQRHPIRAPPVQAGDIQAILKDIEAMRVFPREEPLDLNRYLGDNSWGNTFGVGTNRRAGRVPGPMPGQSLPAHIRGPAHAALQAMLPLTRQLDRVGNEPVQQYLTPGTTPNGVETVPTPPRYPYQPSQPDDPRMPGAMGPYLQHFGLNEYDARARPPGFTPAPQPTTSRTSRGRTRGGRGGRGSRGPPSTGRHSTRRS